MIRVIKLCDVSEKECTKQIGIISAVLLIAFCCLLGKCTYASNQYALNYHKAVEVCKHYFSCIKCYAVATDPQASYKDCYKAKVDK